MCGTIGPKWGMGPLWDDCGLWAYAATVGRRGNYGPQWHYQSMEPQFDYGTYAGLWGEGTTVGLWDYGAIVGLWEYGATVGRWGHYVAIVRLCDHCLVLRATVGL